MFQVPHVKTEGAPRSDGPHLGPGIVGIVSSCFCQGDKVLFRVDVIYELLSILFSRGLLSVDLLKDSGT